MIISLLVLIQQRAAGITAGFSGVNQMQVQRRGAEKVMYQTTIVCSVLLVCLSILGWYL